MVTGNSVTAAVLMTRNRICASVAVSGSGLSVCNSRMALSPSGVAALSSPSMLAAMFMVMLPSAGWPAGTPGNRRRNSGASPRAIRSIRPARSPTFMMPSHSVITPVRPSAISNAVFEVSNSDLTIWAGRSVAPNSTTCNSVVKIATRMNPAQMTFSNMAVRPAMKALHDRDTVRR